MPTVSLNYLYFLFLIIPIVAIVVYQYKEKIKKNNAVINNENTMKFDNPLYTSPAHLNDFPEDSYLVDNNTTQDSRI